MKSAWLAVGLTTAALVASCSPPPQHSGTAEGTAVTGEITVYAAASLQPTFTDLGDRFERDHPGTTVTFNFAGSSSLVTQLVQGAPADVFASANPENMAKAVDSGVVSGAPPAPPSVRAHLCNA